MSCYGRHAAALGITRIADVTGLDYVGIPVFMAIRPNARALSVSQGKGLDSDSARASAFMEAAELEIAGNIQKPLRWSSTRDLKRRAVVLNPARLPRAVRRRLPADEAIAWIEGHDLASGESVWLPFELVHADFRVPEKRGSGWFVRSSNGLASGNHRTEAVSAALCEVIERDAASLWRYRNDQDRAGRRLRLDSVHAPEARGLLNHLAAAGIAVALWDMTTDLGVAAFLCRIREAQDNSRSSFGAFWGAGSHLARDVALIRAVTEAVQSRLTYIAGSRDDLRRGDYAEPAINLPRDHLMDHWERRVAGREFRSVADGATATLDGDVARLLAKLSAAGSRRAVAVDLGDNRFGVPVVRVVVEDLEHVRSHAGVPGARAATMAGTR